MKVDNKNRLAEVLKAPANKPQTNTPRNQTNGLEEAKAATADAVRVGTDSRLNTDSSKTKSLDEIKARVESGEYMKELDTQKVAVAFAADVF